MNEEALKYSYSLFKNDGYNGSIEDYKQLISSDDEALNYSHKLFSNDGYNGNINDFSELVGVKKKGQSSSGSNQTQPTSGSKTSQFDPDEYLRRAKVAGWDTAEEYTRAGNRYKENVSDEELAYIQPNNTNKKVIYRGTREELESQIAGDVKKEVSKSYTSESTVPKQAKQQPVRTAEEEQANTKVRKLSDITYMNENPDDFYSTYYDIFNKEAQKSGNPEQFEKDLKDKYADDFIDEEFKEEYTIATELRYIQDKMKKEIEAIKNSPSSNTPDGQKYLQSKIAEYTNLIKSKTSKLDEVRKNNNQRYQQRIDEIDNLFKTGEAAMREDNLMEEKNNLIRRMNLIKLVENPMALKEQVGEAEYKKIPGSTADEKLNNYLNTKLTIYDQFKADAVDAAFNKNKYFGEKKDRAENVYNTYTNLQSELKDLYYLSTLRRYVNPEERSNFFQAAGEGFLRDFAGGMLNFDDVGRKHSENLQKIAEEAGIQYSDKDKSFIEYTSAPAQPWSGEWWGDMSGTSSAFMTELALTRKPTNVALEAAGAAIKAAPQISKIAKGVLSRYDKLGKTGQKFVNTVFNAAEEGVYFEGTNQMLHNGESSELTFLTGFTGGLLAAPVNAVLKKTGNLAFKAFEKGAAQEIGAEAVSAERAAVLEAMGAQKDEVKTILSQFVKPTAGNDAVYMIAGTFGKETPKVVDLLSKVGTHLIARPTGEVAEEFGEDLASIYQETSNFEEFKTEFSARYPDADAVTQFVVASYMMGVGFGGGNFIGDVFIKKSKQGYDALPPEQKKIADKAIAEADREIKDKESEVLNEQEMNTPKKEKSKEEVEWDNKKSEIETKIANHDSEISGLEEMKQSIYSKYGITDPKTQDISGLSEDDAQKIEAINSSIQSNKKNKAKEEVGLSLHDKKKPVIEEEEESPLAVHADQLINRNKENAVQKPSTEEVLPREQGATPETGGQPQGMGQSVQGQEATTKGQEVSQEGVNRLNKETFAEDVTPEQKTKVEEQNQKDEDEAIDEIYDFNEEVKSIGTKEQFKQFLRSLSPTAAFSRIAWHNTNKPTLEPREGQYYTNTRKNAQDTYKGENTFPAIVFGNAPKKATFDEVQDVNTEAVKGEGADVVVTDDLSPAIGAEMNYREFVPTSADQIIPIGTKENIDAFKAFVEQQKASEEAKPATEEKVQPEISLSGLVNGFVAKSKSSFDPRSNNNVMEFAQGGKSFAEVVDLDGKKHVVVGLALEGDKRAYGAGTGRDRFSFASAELNETTPDNIVEILQNAARDNFKNLYKDFDSKEETIKPITEVNPELETKKESKSTVKEDIKPTEQEKVQPEAQEVVKEKLSDEDKKSIDSISKDLEEYLKNNPEQYFPGEKKDGKVNVKVKGGLLDIRDAALNSDKRKSIPTPTSLPFLPKIINLKHLARNKSDKKSILKNGFDENQVNLDSPIPGIYFSSDDWSNIGRFDRSTKNSLFASIENEGLIYFDSAKEFEDFLKENNLPGLGGGLTKDQVDFLRSKGIKGILLREDYASSQRNELIVIDKSIIKDVSESEKEITDLPSSLVEPKSISKAYYLAKKNNSNPELVEAVEKAIGERSITTKEEAKPTEETKPVEETKPTEETNPNPNQNAKVNIPEDKKTNFSKFRKKIAKKIQDILQAKYPEIELLFITSDNPIAWSESSDDVFNQISNKKREEYKKSLEKKRPDLVKKGLIDSVLEDISKFGEENSADGTGNPRLEKLAAFWIANGNVTLPEDGFKIVDADKIASQNKIDPFSFKDPTELINNYKLKEKSDRINPDRVKEFTNKKEVLIDGEKSGVVVYDVQDDRAGMEAVRRIIDSHFGEDANPWCLAARINGSLDSAFNHWKGYGAITKKIAFKDGKLLAFKANDEAEDAWWDRNDKSTNGIPIIRKSDDIKVDNAKVTRSFNYNEDGQMVSKGNIFIRYKNKTEEYSLEDDSSLPRIIKSIEYKDGKKDGIEYEYSYSYEVIDDIFSSDVIYKTTWKNGKKDGISSTISNDLNGEVIESQIWKNGKKNGAYYKNNNYDSLGNKISEDPDYEYFTKATYKDGELEGNYVTRLNDKILLDLNFSKGKLNGIQKSTDRNLGIKYEGYFENDVISGPIKETFQDGSSTEYILTPNSNIRFKQNPGTAFDIGYYKGLDALLNSPQFLNKKIESYYSDGSLSYRETYEVYPDIAGSFLKSRTDWYFNGQIRRETVYGKPDPKRRELLNELYHDNILSQKDYYPDGNLKRTVEGSGKEGGYEAITNYDGDGTIESIVHRNLDGIGHEIVEEYNADYDGRPYLYRSIEFIDRERNIWNSPRPDNEVDIKLKLYKGPGDLQYEGQFNQKFEKIGIWKDYSNDEVIEYDYGYDLKSSKLNGSNDPLSFINADTFHQKDKSGDIIGQADIKAMTVLIDAAKQRQDTLPHEYAHHYIAWFRDTPIVQEGIKRFGSEEKLVQAIGEQVVKQEGDAYNWWKKFTNWVLNLLSDRQVLQILTDSFLNRYDLRDQFTYNESADNSIGLEEAMVKKAVDELMTAKKKRGAKKIDEMKNVKEKYGQMGKKLDYIDRNFDKLIDKLGIVKSCWLE